MIMYLIHVWLKIKEDKTGYREIKFIFPGGGTKFIHGAKQYLDQISKVFYLQLL